MSDNDKTIDYSDIPPITYLVNVRKNPHAEVIKKRGFSIMTHFSPEDIEKDLFDDTKEIVRALVELMTASETKRLLRFIKDNYDLPCSPNVWDCLDEKV